MVAWKSRELKERLCFQSNKNGRIEYSLCVGWQSANDTKTVCSNVEIINIQGTLQINE